jgi:hypothetical protein
VYDAVDTKEEIMTENSHDLIAECPDEEWRLMPWVYYVLGIVTGMLIQWVLAI